ncbi:MAG TPA: hypothetical protein QGH10_09295 [Armatimonadota bacterium]|nr:hypothetical protein [Armatimonadota bacterium]
MTRKLTIGMFLCIALAVVVFASVVAQAPGGGGEGGRRGGGMMGSMMYLERTWTAVSFQLDCTTEQLAALKPTYRNALADRDAKLKAAMEAQNWESMRTIMEDCKTRIETKLKEVLSDAQETKLDGLMNRGRSGGGGGWRGGTGGGGGAPH